MRNASEAGLRSICRLTLGLLLAFLATSQAHSDWVNLGGAEVAPNIAEFHIQDDGVRVKLEVFVGDLPLFADLIPGAWLTGSDTTLVPDAVRLERFARDRMGLRADGVPLAVELREVDRRLRVDRASPLAGSVDPYTGRRLPEPPDDPRVLYAELFYPFEDARPARLEVRPPMDDDGSVAATIGMVVFHRAVPVIDFRYLSAPAGMDLDWNDPWNSRFDNPNLTRHHKYPRMAFLYAEPYEIRQEALVRVRDAAALVGHDLAGKTLDASTAEALAQNVARELAGRTPLEIDGQPVVPDFDRSAFMRIGMRGLEIIPPGEDVNVDAGILGLIWSSPVDGLPQSASMTWDWFDSATEQVAGYAIDAAGPFLSPLTPVDPTLVWTNHFKTPPYPEIAAISLERSNAVPPLVAALAIAATLGLAVAAGTLILRPDNRRQVIVASLTIATLSAGGAFVAMQREAQRLPNLEDTQLHTLVQDLLNNVYRAFDFRLEDQVYDRLALTLDGDILERVYLEQRKSLRIERAGGADARVEALEVQAAEPLAGAEPGTLGVRADWLVRGRVGHWGHVHNRTNAYEADLVLQPVDGAWKISGFDVRSQERLQ